ncbi:MAG TPA: threonine/serine exporter family protein [Thermomicrobiales bacterium]|nr:threonine/serine exporter family protein [Thermomicrobiales bacterium]
MSEYRRDVREAELSEPLSSKSSVDQRDSPLTMPEPSGLIEFVSQLGMAMSAAGESVSSIQGSLAKIAQAYGTDAQIAVLPNILLVKSGEREVSEVGLASGVVNPLRLDQTAEVFELARLAKRAEISPLEGLKRLDEILRGAPRYGAAARILGYALVAVGIGLILEGSFSQLVTCILLGVLIGELKELCAGNRTAEALVPVVAALLVGMIVFSIVKADLVTGPLMLLIPPVVTFLPGAMLTTAMLELANGDVISGSSRLVAGAIQLLLLVFGFIVAAQITGLPTAEAFAQAPRPLFAWWAAWIGVLIYGVGNYVHHSAPKHSLPWLLVVLYVAFAGQQLGNQTVGGYLSGFVGAVAMTPVAYWIQRRPGAPPAQVTFLPGFWLLVPGSLGLIGLTQFAADNRQSALETVGNMTLAIVAVALGVMVGVSLVRPIGQQLGKLHNSTERSVGRLIGKTLVVFRKTSDAARSEIDRSRTEPVETGSPGDDDPSARESA